MKGNVDLISTLNLLLADELTAISQYMVHSEMCANWGLERLHKATEKRAIDEMKHAEKLIARILFLEGTPEVSRLNSLQIGPDAAAQLDNDRLAEARAVRAYNDGMAQAVKAGDNGTRELLEDILEDEEAHIDRLETQLEQIKQMGLQNYLAQQVNAS
jgi:bacterioferritin